MPATETVLFDLDATLCEYRQDAADVLAAAFDAVGAEPFCDPPTLWSAADDVPDADDDVHFMEQAFGLAAERNGGDPARTCALAEAYSDAIDHSDVRLRDGARAALDAVREDYRVGLVTNGGRPAQEEKLDALGLHDAFETVVYAGDMTPPKPDPAPFHHALDDLGATADRAVHVGDSLSADVAGARAAGLGAVWVPHEDAGTPDEHAPDHTLETPEELPDVL